MANIYEKQAVSDFSNKFYSHEGNSGQWLMKEGEKLVNQGEKTEDKAKTTYSNALNVDWQNSMNSLINNPKYASDPKALQEEAKKLTDKMSSEIVDDDVKVDFLVNAQLKGGTYINKAIANARKIEEDNYRSSLLDSIYSGIDTEATVLSNGISGTGNRQDLANAVYSNDVITRALYRKNPDGSYVFSDAQRRQIIKERENLAFNSFKASFDALPEDKRRDVYDKIKHDKMSFGTITDEEGNEKELYLQDVVSKETYNKYKSFASDREENEILLKKREIALRDFQEKQAMYDTEQQLSDRLDDLDPTEALHLLEQSEGVVSEKYYKAKQRALLSAKGITAETRAEEATNIILDIATLQGIEDSEDYIKEADKILTKIEEKYADGRLALADKKTLTTNVKKKIGSELPTFVDDKSHWWNKYSWKDAYNDIQKSIPDDSSSNSVFLDYFRTLNKYESDLPEPQKRDLVKALVNKQVMKEFNLPVFNNVEEMRQALARGKIKKGDTVYVAGQRGKVGQ